MKSSKTHVVVKLSFPFPALPSMSNDGVRRSEGRLEETKKAMGRERGRERKREPREFNEKCVW